MKKLLLFASLMLSLLSTEAWAINYQPSDIGKLIGSDGNVYATATAMPSGVTVSGMIAYVNTSEQWGLAIGPADLNHNSTEGSGKSTQGQARSACSGYDRARAKTAISRWRLPSQDDFNRMIGADGCQSADNLRQLKGRQANSCASDAAGIWAMQTDEGYWSSTETEDAIGIYYNLWAGDCNSVADANDLKYVRPCFTFSYRDITYVDHEVTGTGADAVVKEVVGTLSAGTFITGDDLASLVVDGNVVIDGRETPKTVVFMNEHEYNNPIVILGTVNMIICKNTPVYCNKGINVASGNTLNIYHETGAYNIFGSLLSRLVVKGAEGNAGIGSNANEYAGIINIHGTSIEAEGGTYGAGIGGGNHKGFFPTPSLGGLNVYGGEVEAKGGMYAAGIGSGNELDSSDAISGYIKIYGGEVRARGYWGTAAGIGGGRYSGGAIVAITGGKVSAGLQYSSYRAIGPGKGCEDYGHLTIGDAMTVWGGPDCDNVSRVSKDQRQGACWYNEYAIITKCDHKDCTYAVSGTTANDTHTRLCQFCSVTFQPEQHTFHNGKCTVCGVETAVYTATVYNPSILVFFSDEWESCLPSWPAGNDGYSSQKFTFVAGSEFELPSSPVNPPGYQFAGWIEGTPDGLTSYLYDAETEVLIPGGQKYTMDKDISLTARFVPLHLTLADDSDNSQTIINYNARKATSVTLQGRTLYKDGDWNTLCLPFEVVVSKSPLSGDGVRVMELDADATHFDATDLLTVSFKPVTNDTLVAGKPYIIKWNNTGENLESPVFSRVRISNTAPVEVAFDGGMFVGNYSPFAIDEENINEIAYLGAGNTLGYADAPRTLRSCRAHFELPTVNGARAMTRSIIYFGEETSDIKEVETNSQLSTLNSQFSGWYTIDGRKLAGEPTQKGVYIHDGRKVVIK